MLAMMLPAIALAQSTNSGGNAYIPGGSAASYSAGVSSFGGLQFSVSQGGISSPGGTMTGYAVGDRITLSCPGMTWAIAPIIGVSAVTTGAVSGSVVTSPGVSSGIVPAGQMACAQASTTGSGTGYTVTVTLGVIAAYVAPSALNTGGSAFDGNFFLNMSYVLSDAINNATGPENTFMGTKAGVGFLGNSSYNTVVGHNACGNGGTGAISSNNTCLGDDAGRNIQGSASNGANTLLGAGAGRNLANGNNTCTGYNACGSNGANSAGTLNVQNATSMGANSAKALTTGSGNSFYGVTTGSAITTGAYNLIVAAQGATDVCLNGNTTSWLALCASNTLGPVISEYGVQPTVTSGGGTSPTVNANGTFVFEIVEGATGTPGTTLVLGMPAAKTDWICPAILDRTSTTITARQSGVASTTSLTVTFSSAPSNSDVIEFICGSL